MNLLLRCGFPGRSEAKSCSDSHCCWACLERIVVAQHPSGSIGMNRHLVTLAVIVDPRRFGCLIRFVQSSRNSVYSLRFVRKNRSSVDSYHLFRSSRSSVGLIRLARMNQCSVGLPGSVDLIHALRTNRCFAGFPVGSPHKSQLQKNLVVRSLVGSAGSPDWIHSSILVAYLGRLAYPQHGTGHCRTLGHRRTGHSRRSYRSQVPSRCLLLVPLDARIPMNVCAIGCRIGVASGPSSC